MFFLVEDTILYAEVLKMTHIYTYEHTNTWTHKTVRTNKYIQASHRTKINIQKSVCFYALTMSIQKNEQINCNVNKNN